MHEAPPDASLEAYSFDMGTVVNFILSLWIGG
jgi:hypothetical protein